MNSRHPSAAPSPGHASAKARPEAHAWARTARLACTLSVVALLASCAVLGNKPAPPLRSYTLDSAAPAATPGAPRVFAGPVLLVEVPRAAPGYDSTRMVYVRQAQTQEAFAQSVWADTPARLLAPLLVQHLQQSGPFRAVLLAPSAAGAGLRLDSTILRLQQDFLQVPSQLRFTLQLTLMDNSTRQVMAWRTVDVVQPAPSDDAAGGAMAAQLAVQQGLQQVSDFLQSAVVAVPVKD
jgi:cholesterol transport system auxiliary component